MLELGKLADQRSRIIGLAELERISGGEETEFGSRSFVSRIRRRSAGETEVVLGDFTPKQEKTIAEVLEYISNNHFLRIDGSLCRSRPFYCRAYVPEKYARVGYIWRSTLFDETGEPDFRTIVIPDWPQTMILSDVESKVTLILGSDYAGELKMANLRLAMYQMKQEGGLGLHAGSKRMGSVGMLLFGLSATGKTTLTCHDHFTEKITILQDDIVLLQKNGRALGTENNFYVKTIGLNENEPIIFDAVRKKEAILENVMVKDGNVDFFDDSLTSNGRAVVRRNQMESTSKDVDLEKVDMAVFITRRNTIVPPVAKLTRKQGAAFFMLGESVGTSASDIEPGKPRRVVGTNPFIVGPKEDEGNRFYDLLKNIQCYLLNTGKIGEGGNGEEKITVHDSAIILREIAKNNVKWMKDPDWGYEILDHCPEVDISRFHPERHYSSQRYRELTEELKEERRNWLSQFENLYPEIKNAI